MFGCCGCVNKKHNNSSSKINSPKTNNELLNNDEKITKDNINEVKKLDDNKIKMENIIDNGKNECIEGNNLKENQIINDDDRKNDEKITMEKNIENKENDNNPESISIPVNNTNSTTKPILPNLKILPEKNVPNNNNSKNNTPRERFTNPEDIIVISSTNESGLPRKSSLKKKVNIREQHNEIITGFDLLPTPAEDDDVFSDAIPSPLPRGDMCTPYQKRGTSPGLIGLPDWFNTDDREIGGICEPPNTPIGRDELALKRHRFFSELLTAAQAAQDHRVRFDPLGPMVSDQLNAVSYLNTGLQPNIFQYQDCDPNFKPSTSTELEYLVNRLERLLDRLERTVLARELKFASDALILNQQDLEKEGEEEKLVKENLQKDFTEKLEKRITELEINLNKSQEEFEIPIVVSEIYLDKELNMSVNGYEDIVLGYLAPFLKVAAEIGGDVATQADLVKKAFDAQFQYIKLAAASAQPPQNKQVELLKPTSDQISAIQSFRESNRKSKHFNHLSAISESIPALGWVCVSPTPGPHVKEMNDAGQFYTNRVLKEWKEKDPKHAEWCRAWIAILTELQKYIKQYHTTGLVWSGKTQLGSAGGAPPPPPGCPPPPPMIPLGDLSISDNGQERNALFAQINQGEAITKSLKKVTPDMQTHKNTQLRSGPAPFVTPQPYSKPTVAAKPTATMAAVKEPVFVRDGKKWMIEYQKSNNTLKVENAEMNNVVYMFKCENSTLTVTGKINSIVIDSCKKCSILFDSLVSSIEFVNCQSVQMQALGKIPTISIDKSDGCQMYLSKDSLDVEIVSSKSSEMNVLIPTASGDYTEQPIPEQYKTTIKGNSLSTICVESLG